MKNVFISFSSKNTEEAERICSFLEANGVSCFIATRDLIPGEEYALQLIENLDHVESVVLLLSKDSNESPHVLREIEYAVGHKIPILVYALEEVELSKSLEYFLMTHQWITLTDDRDKKLLEGVGYLLKKSPNNPFHRATNSNLTKGKTDALNNDEFTYYSSKFSGKDSSSHNFYSSRRQNNTNKTNSSPGKQGIRKIMPVLLLIALCLVFVTVYSSINRNSTTPEQTTTDEASNSNQAVNSSTDTDSTQNVSEDTQEPVKALELGDTVLFGSYAGEPIEWRIIHINEYGNYVLLSKDILCMKAFDAAEGGTYNEYEGVDYWSYENHIITDENLSIMVRGNNDWALSNIRTWLNSDEEMVTYSDQAPTKAAVGNNFYNTEAGFLSSFTTEEKSAIVPTTNISIANTFSSNSTNGNMVTTDLVYLLSSDELKWLADANMFLYAKPSAKCIEMDQNTDGYTYFSDAYKIDSYYWWLRDSKEGKINESDIVVTEVEDGYTTVTASVGAYSYGVRPAITVSPSAELTFVEP